MQTFNELLKLADDFVKQKECIWDHPSWESIIKIIEEKDIILDDDGKDMFGVLLEAMAGAYIFSEGCCGSIRLSEVLIKHFESTGGSWDHREWESFLESVSEEGIYLTEENVDYFGELLEASKALFNIF